MAGGVLARVLTTASSLMLVPIGHAIGTKITPESHLYTVRCIKSEGGLCAAPSEQKRYTKLFCQI